MRWRPSSRNQIEDRRGAGGGGLGGISMGGLGGGGIPIPMGRGGLSIGGIVLVVIIYIVIQFLSSGSGLGGPSQGGVTGSLDPDDDIGIFINAVTVDVQDFWEAEFEAANKDYPETVTVLFDGQTQTGCGAASSATGPFYCPPDQKIFLDTSFFRELAGRFGAPGDFAQAYVIAHEYGHRVQDVLGTMDTVQSQQQTNPSNANDLSIRLELQADCYAGMWAHDIDVSPDQSEVEAITDADVQEALTAAAAVGDDRIQQQATGTINKESWTHGSAEQRTKWFNVGFKDGTIESCDTFAVAAP
jgi:uncharacterized protein